MSACWRPTSSRGSRRPDRPRRSVHEDRYLDTEDGALEAAGYSGRLRSTGKGDHPHAQGPGAPRQRRLDAPARGAGGSGGSRAAAGRVARHRRLGTRSSGSSASAPLRDLVALRQVRQKRNYALNGTVVEVSVDDVEVLVGAQVAERFAELELELREGDEVNLEPLADMLGEIEELVAVDSSKFERALEVVRREPRDLEPDEVDAAAAAARPRGGGDPPLRPIRRAAAPTAQVGPGDGHGCGGRRRGGIRRRPRGGARRHARSVPEPPRILVPKSPGVLADDHIAEAGRKVLRFHLARMVAREAGTRDGDGCRGAARDARRDASSAGGVARVRRCLRPEAHGAPPEAAASSWRPTSARSATSTS